MELCGVKSMQFVFMVLVGKRVFIRGKAFEIILNVGFIKRWRLVDYSDCRLFLTAVNLNH